MLTRRAMLATPAAFAAQTPPKAAMTLCLHQTTLAAAGYRRSLEGAAKAGIRLIEVIPPHLEAFIKTDGMPAARRLLSDLGLKAVSSGGVAGLFDTQPGRPQAIEQLKALAPTLAEFGVDRMVCPCRSTAQYTLDDYKRAVDNAREVGGLLQPYKITAMPEFMRGSTFIGTLPTVLEMTRAAAHPNVRPMFDCYHFWAGLSKFEDLELLRDGEIHHVHFQDVPRMPRELLDSATRDIPGDGISPLPRILRALSNKGYHGPLSVELFYPHIQKGDPFEVCTEIRRKAEVVMRLAELV